MKTVSMSEGAKNLFITKTHFEELKRRLKTVAFRYYIADMHDIPEMLKNERFNVIYLSASHEFIYPTADELNILFYLDLLNEFKQLLKEGGTMQAAYFYSPLFEIDKDYYTFRSMMIEANGYKREDLKLDMYLGEKTLIDRAYVYRK